MNIQSLSVCVPAKKCINDCRFCCSKMHAADFEDHFSDLKRYASYSDDMRKRLRYARENGCNTCMLTGNVEPQQNREFLRVFSEINRSLPMPFLNIEMQTTGAFIDADLMDFLRQSVGVTTVAVSVACLDDDSVNRDMIRTGDAGLSLARLCGEIRKRDLNLRLCLNMNDEILVRHEHTPESIVSLCSALGADQITFRALWAPDDGSDQSLWVKEHVTERTYRLIDTLKADIPAKGRYLNTLEYGSDRYDYYGFSVIVDEDCMSHGVNREAVKYLILRPNGHLYSKWDSNASLIF